MRRVAVVALALALACGGSPMGLDDAEAIEPFDWFAGIYSDMEACSGVDGDFAGVRWFGVLNRIQVSDDSIETLRDPSFGVEWRPPHSIYLGMTRVEGGPTPAGTYVFPIDVRRGSLRDLFQSAEVPETAQEACGVPEPVDP